MIHWKFNALSEIIIKILAQLWTDSFVTRIIIKCKQTLMDALLYLMCEVISVYVLLEVFL